MRPCCDPSPVFFSPLSFCRIRHQTQEGELAFQRFNSWLVIEYKLKQLLLAQWIHTSWSGSELVLLSLLGFRHPRVKHSALLGLEMPGRALWEEARSTEIHSSLWLADSQRGGKKKRKDCHLISTVNNSRSIYLLRFFSISVLYFRILVTTKLWKW